MEEYYEKDPLYDILLFFLDHYFHLLYDINNKSDQYRYHLFPVVLYLLISFL